MAVNNIRIVDVAGYNVIPTRVYQTAASATAIPAGEFVMRDAAGGQNAALITDNYGVVGTSLPLLGLTARASTHTAAAAGTVEVYLPLSGITYEAAATTAANVDTQAEIDALAGNRVLLDVIAAVTTVDEDLAEAVTNGIVITGGDPVRRTLTFTVRHGVTELGDMDITA